MPVVTDPVITSRADYRGKHADLTAGCQPTMAEPRMTRPAGRGTAGAGAVKPPEKIRGKLEAEVGDLLFAAVNLARYLSLDPESALKRTNRKFRRRFEFIEQQLRAQNRRPEDCALEEMEALWQQSKGQGNETPPR